ncbi:hypothetical protein CONLIGDRAFT_679740 [Coniochaeta ligniaria NRRL 30616]|uniref:Uncharacterized protein n=1 Tax=Coniochaeta ligniaria NRRL 30616 TaxID=1408157 RepID=A0A1J7JM91_9PEZI|nr:hypothetical protein CONLIGDRAFT_679740 [Coniochaeta ligniaria NRRL 30616]
MASSKEPWLPLQHRSDATFRDLETTIRQTPSAPSPDIGGVDLDTALQQAIMNLKINKLEDAPLMDYTKSAMPPKVQQLCLKLGLSMPHTKRAVFDSRLSLEFSISKKHGFHDYHVRDIVDSLSPFQDRTLDFHVARHEREPLWLNVVELGGKKVKPIVKTRGVKRVKHAFAEALRRNGYEKHGNPLSAKEAKEAGTEPAPKRLYGTVRARIFEPKKVCSVPYAEVVDFWERHIAERIGNVLGGRSRNMLEAVAPQVMEDRVVKDEATTDDLKEEGNMEARQAQTPGLLSLDRRH